VESEGQDLLAFLIETGETIEQQTLGVGSIAYAHSEVDELVCCGKIVGLRRNVGGREILRMNTALF